MARLFLFPDSVRYRGHPWIPWAADGSGAIIRKNAENPLNGRNLGGLGGLLHPPASADIRDVRGRKMVDATLLG